jgi:hypothetical protein
MSLLLDSGRPREMSITWEVKERNFQEAMLWIVEGLPDGLTFSVAAVSRTI